ncbi:MAG: aspartyl protease family protein [Dehalococcoidia bacterium]|nr:aspartyl protease family protein [Dehalococcoidia bacterium]
MGRTFATTTIIGAAETREYEFLVDTGATHIGLPQEELDELDLSPIPNGVISVRTANGIIEQQSYWALGEIDGRGFGATVTQAPIPLIGYHLLQTMRYRVNPVTESLERLPEDEFGPPYLLLSGFQVD